MIIQRKPKTIAKRNATVNSTTNTLSKTRTLGYSDYRLPYLDAVPADMYYSKIVHVENTTTYSGKAAIAVFYKMVKFSDVYRTINKLSSAPKEVKQFKIKQIYPLDSQPYADFLEAMYAMLGVNHDEKLDMQKLIGLKEAITIAYTNSNGIGGISYRREWRKSYFVELYEQPVASVSAEDNCEYIDYDEYGNMI